MHPAVNALWRIVLSVEGMERDALCVLKERKLKKVLIHAARAVPFYRRFFMEKGIAIDDIALSDFPIIEKKDIRGRENEFVADSWSRKLHWTRTSGSTGEPFRFGRSEYDYTYATLWRGLARWGVRPGDKRVLVKGVDIERNVSFLTRFKRVVYGWINRCIVVDAHFLAKSDSNVERELRRIVRYRPQYIHGYASSIYLLARHAEKLNLDCSALGLKAVVTESEKCHDFQRETLERVFHAPVVENYGSVEFGMIAQPAKDGRMCINEDHVYVEMTPEGEAVFTNLDEYGFPLIRFKNGDLLTIGGIHDELPYRTLSSIEGRKTETIKLPQGGAVQGFAVMYPISKHSRLMKAYQIWQPSIDRLVIRIVPSQIEFPMSVKRQIISEMRDIVGDEMKIDFEFQSCIPLSSRGKRLFVCSDVERRCD